jgi:hypothetical protein
MQFLFRNKEKKASHLSFVSQIYMTRCLNIVNLVVSYCLRRCVYLNSLEGKGPVGASLFPSSLSLLTVQQSIFAHRHFPLSEQDVGAGIAQSV